MNDDQPIAPAKAAGSGPAAGSKRPSRRTVLAASAACLASGLGLFSPLARAQSARTVRIVVGFNPGGGTDTIARQIAEKLRGGYAPSVIVENRAGAAGRLAIDYVKASEPDGNTILFTPDFSMTGYQFTFKKLNYDAQRDFTPLATCAKVMFTITAGPGLPASVGTLQEFVQWCKANPKQALFGSTSVGGAPHMLGVMLSRASGVEITPVHYKGGAPTMNDLLAGVIPVSTNTVSEVLPHLKSGRVRVLAVSGSTRSSFLPEVPTLVESGYKDVVAEAWWGLFVPSRTPAETTERLTAAITQAVRSPELIQAFQQAGNEPYVVAGTELGALIRKESERWGPVVKASGFVADE